MRPPTTAIALLGALCAAAALNGCSSSVQPSGKISGAGSGVTATSNGVSATSDSSSGNTLPADLSLDFTDPQLSGVSEVIYTSAKSFVQSYEAAASAGRISNTGLTSALNVAAIASVAQTLHDDAASGHRWAGTISFSHFQVALLSKASGIGFCESDTAAYPVTIAGDVRKGSSPTGAEAVRAWSLSVAKQGNGYQITGFSTDPGDAACM